MTWPIPLRSGILSAVVLFGICILGADVKVNEVLYDPVGSDAGYEWIELFNSGDVDIDLEGAYLQRGGAEFVTVFTFPHYILRAGRFVLLGENQVPNAAFTASFVFQNGDGGTDGIRFVSADGSYTDTVLYDEPNANGLWDDSGGVGASFAQDVPAGSSLARFLDGYDSNASGKDFIAETDPSPGLPNHRYCDYAIQKPAIDVNEDLLQLRFEVANLSWFDANQMAELNIYLDGALHQSRQIAPIAGETSILSTEEIDLSGLYPNVLHLELVCVKDPDLTNNIWQYQFSVATEGIFLNEFMYDPITGQQEWIELKVLSSGNRDLSIRDETGNSFSFYIPYLADAYVVLCTSAEQLLEQYPNCPPGAVIEVSPWAALNNSGDVILLLDEEGGTVDSVAYIGSASFKGKSLEKTEAGIWRYSLAEGGATPGLENSISQVDNYAFSGKVKLEGSPFKARQGEELRIHYQLEGENIRANCKVFDLNGKEIRTLASNRPIEPKGFFSWDGKTEGGKFAKRGLYILLWESQASGRRIFRKQLTCVVAD